MGAEYFQTSKRSLQRRLAKENTSWAELRKIAKVGDESVSPLESRTEVPGDEPEPLPRTTPFNLELTEELVEEKILYLLETADDPRILDSAIGKAISFLEKKKKLSTGDEDSLGFTPSEIQRLSEGYFPGELPRNPDNLRPGELDTNDPPGSYS